MLKLVLGSVVGIVVAFVTIFVAEIVGHRLFPPPAGVDFNDPAQLAAAMARLPLANKLAVVIGWFVGTLVGAYVADRIARRGLAGGIVAVAVVLAAYVNMAMIPHPGWMWTAGVLLPLAAGWIAWRAAPAPR